MTSPLPPDAESSTDAGEARPRTSLVTLLLHHSITVIILVLFLAIAVWAYLNIQSADFLGSVDHETLEADLTPSLQAAQHQRVVNALTIYELLENRYPRQLRDLVESELLLTSDLYYPSPLERWDYTVSGTTYELRPQRSDPDQEVPD